MENYNLIELSPCEAFERMQMIREKVHLDYATHQEIEELNELEYIMHDSIEEFQSEFWA